MKLFSTNHNMQITILVNTTPITLTRDKHPYLYAMAVGSGGVEYAVRVIQGLLTQNGWSGSKDEGEIYSAIRNFEMDMVYN
jgi:hypothetical protein